MEPARMTGPANRPVIRCLFRSVQHRPFDHEQWKQVLDPEKGAISFLVHEEETLIGHAALDRAEEPGTRMG